MSGIDLIYEFKQQFNDRNAHFVIRSVIQHKKIWEQLINGHLLADLKNTLPQSIEFWIAPYICLAYSENQLLKIENHESAKNHFFALESQLSDLKEFKINSLVDHDFSLKKFASLAARIDVVKKEYSCWEDLFTEFGLSFLTKKQILDSWGTIFSIIYFFSNNRKQLVHDWGNSELSVLNDILAFVISANPFLFQQEELEINVKEIRSEKIIKILSTMRAFGNIEDSILVADAFLKNHTQEVIDISQHESEENIEDCLSQIKLYKNLALITGYSSQSEHVQEISEKIVATSNRLNHKLLQLSEQISKDHQVDEKSYTQKIIDIGKIQNRNPILCKFQQATLIEEIDEDSAVMLLKEVSNAILTTNGCEEIFWNSDNDSRFLTEQLIQRLLNLGMIREAAEITEKFLEIQPGNIELLRIGANLNYQYGDYARAAQLFTQLDLISHTTREEKICLASCLEKTNNWVQALHVWEKVNLVNQDDFLRKAICAYRAKNLQVLLDMKHTAESFRLSDNFLRILHTLLSMKQGSQNQLQELIEGVISDQNAEVNEIKVLTEYLVENSHFELARKFINSLPEEEQANPEIAILHYDILQNFGDVKICNEILEKLANKKILDLVLLEKIIERCTRQNACSKARGILEKTSKNWILSPNINGLKARLLVDRNEYSQGKRILEKLIKRSEPKRDWILDYGLTLLECTHQDFPLRNKKSQELRSSISESDLQLFSGFSNDLEMQIIHVELNNAEKLNIYQSFINEKNYEKEPQIWRVHAGIAQLCYFNKQFDLALVNFKEAIKYQPGNKLLYSYLLSTFLKMHLVDEALEIAGILIDKMSFHAKDWLELNQSFNGYPQWLEYMKKLADNHPADENMQIGLADLFIRNNKVQWGIEVILRLESENKLRCIEKLICAQILIRAGFEKEAKRFVEDTLSSPGDISPIEIISGAILFAQIEDYQKALNVLNLIQDTDSQIQGFKAALSLKNNQTKETLKFINSTLDSNNQIKNDWNMDIPKWLQMPRFLRDIQKDFTWMIKTAVEIQLSTKNIQGALEYANKGISIQPDNPFVKSIALELAYLLGDLDLMNYLLDRIPESNSLGAEACIWAEVALNSGQEVLAANLLSDLIKRYPESARVRALQARMFIRNGNKQEAMRFFDEMFEDKQVFSQAGNSLAEQNVLWKAELAMELGQYHKASLICKNLLERFGFTQILIKSFLICFNQQVFENWINKRLNVLNHLIEIPEDSQELLKNIRDFYKEKDIGANSLDVLLDCIDVFMTEDEVSLRRILSAETSGLPQTAKLIAQYKLDGRNFAQISTENSTRTAETKLVMVILEMDKEPKNAICQLTELMQETLALPQHYACLAYLHQKLGQFEDAYAAINLALAAWPDEYQWQILAGDLSKSQNKIMNALEHFRKAKEIQDEDLVNSRIEELHLQAGNPNSIAFWEKKIKGNENDYPILIMLSEMYIKAGKFQKAVHYLEQARHYQPLEPQAFILMSQVAEKIDNLPKAEGIINAALRLHPSDEQVILQKERIVKKIKGAKAALDFLNSLMQGKKLNSEDLVIEKASLLSENINVETALEYLDEERKGNGNISINLEIAKYSLKIGNVIRAEEFAEKVLLENPNLSLPLRIMASISKQNGDLDKSVDLLIKAIQLDPLEPNIYIELSKIYQTRRDYAQAETILLGGIKMNPQSFNLQSSLGLLYYQQGNYHEAELYLRQAHKKQPRDEQIKRILSMIENVNTNQASHQIRIRNQVLNLNRS